MGFEGYKFKFELRAGHSNVVNDTQNRHFHTFVITLYMRDMDNNVNLYEEVEERINARLDGYRNRYLDETPLFAGIPTTLESMGDVFFDELKEEALSVGFEVIKLEICESPVRSYSVSDRMTDSQVNELTRLPFSFIPQVEHHKEDEAVIEAAAASEKEDVSCQEEPEHKVKAIAAPKQKYLSKSNIMWLLACAMLACVSVAVTLLITDSGLYPRGSDTFCHIYRADLLLQNIKAGNFYPLYDSMWYNGVEIMRYWGPLPLYLLAFLQWLCNDMLGGYTMYVGVMCLLGGTGWLMWGRKYNRLGLGAFMSVIWFFLPQNIMVLVQAGNLPRGLLHNLLPYLLYFLWGYLNEHKKSQWLGIALMFSLMGLCHIGTTIMVAAIVLIYTGLSVKIDKKKGFLKVAAAILCGVMLIGIWVVPSLIGGMTSSGSTNNQVMETFFQSLLVSFNPINRINGDLYSYYFGLSVAIICIIGIAVGSKKVRAGFLTVLLIFICTGNSAYSLLSQLPFSRYLWMIRMVPIVLAIFTMSFLMWDKLKKWFVVAMCALLLLDCIPSYQYIVAADGQKVEDAMGTIMDKGRYLMLESAKNYTKQRLAVYDLSKYEAFAPFYVAAAGKNTRYMFGAGWEGAATAKNIVMLNTAVENKSFVYVFDRSIEMGCDTILFADCAFDEGIDGVVKDIDIAAQKTGFVRRELGTTGAVYTREVNGTFGTVTSYDNLAIGGAANDIAMVFPSFEEGDSDNLDDYTVEELSKYKIVYLSDVKYLSTEEAEEKLAAVAALGTHIVIDMNRLPADSRTNNQAIFGVTAQTVRFKDEYPKMTYEGQEYRTQLFVEEYREWSTVYLEGLAEVTGYGTLNGKKLPFAGNAGIDNITFLGYNLPYHSLTANDEVGIGLLEKIFGESSEKLPDRQIVPVDISYERGKIIINTEYDNVNVALAALDIFESVQQVERKHNLLFVDRGETIINIHYPHFVKGLLLSLVGLIAVIAFCVMGGKEYGYEKRD